MCRKHPRYRLTGQTLQMNSVQNITVQDEILINMSADGVLATPLIKPKHAQSVRIKSEKSVENFTLQQPRQTKKIKYEVAKPNLPLPKTNKQQNLKVINVVLQDRLKNLDLQQRAGKEHQCIECICQEDNLSISSKSCHCQKCMQACAIALLQLEQQLLRKEEKKKYQRHKPKRNSESPVKKEQLVNEGKIKRNNSTCKTSLKDKVYKTHQENDQDKGHNCCVRNLDFDQQRLQQTRQRAIQNIKLLKNQQQLQRLRAQQEEFKKKANLQTLKYYVEYRNNKEKLDQLVSGNFNKALDRKPWGYNKAPSIPESQSTQPDCSHQRLQKRIREKIEMQEHKLRFRQLMQKVGPRRRIAQQKDNEKCVDPCKHSLRNQHQEINLKQFQQKIKKRAKQITKCRKQQRKKELENILKTKANLKKIEIQSKKILNNCAKRNLEHSHQFQIQPKEAALNFQQLRQINEANERERQANRKKEKEKQKILKNFKKIEEKAIAQQQNKQQHKVQPVQENQLRDPKSKDSPIKNLISMQTKQQLGPSSFFTGKNQNRFEGFQQLMRLAQIKNPPKVQKKQSIEQAAYEREQLIKQAQRRMIKNFQQQMKIKKQKLIQQKLQQAKANLHDQFKERFSIGFHSKLIDKIDPAKHKQEQPAKPKQQIQYKSAYLVNKDVTRSSNQHKNMKQIKVQVGRTKKPTAKITRLADEDLFRLSFNDLVSLNTLIL